MTKHGGKRPGAGRPRKTKPMVAASVMLERGQIDDLARRAMLRATTRSREIRRAIDDTKGKP